MQYIKAKFLKENKPTGRAYTYRTEDEVKAGDIVVDDRGSKLLVIDEPVDFEWIRSYGVTKVGIVKKNHEKKSDIDSIDDETKCKYCRYNLDCPKCVRCYGGEPFFPYCVENEPETWFDEESYLEDLEESEE